MSKTTQSYHHGDLRQTLLQAAKQRLESHGIEGLSLRKLAEDAGVSRTAPYHHFKDKNALLSAIAAEGFEQWHKEAKVIFDDDSLTPQVRLKRFIRGYVGYADKHPQMYDLMFGRTIWKSGEPTDDLKSVAFPAFQFQVIMTKEWQKQGLLPTDKDTLRLAQVTWSTLHGIARLLIDGIYADSSHIDDMCDTAASLFMRRPFQDPHDDA